MAKLIVIVGITGNQGGSVARTFLEDPEWRIRGLTRDTGSSASQALSAQGVEMVQANLHNTESLKGAFKGANLVFSVTDFWKPFFDPNNAAQAKAKGKSIGRYAYELEYEQGKNIVDAVAREIHSLDEVGLIASTLCSARESSKGEYQELWHFDSKADVFPKYLKENYPDLAKKTSYLHTGYFFTSWQFLPGRWFAKQPDGSIQMQFPTTPDMLIPHLDPRKDTGPWARALLQLPVNSSLMAASEWLTWPDWIKTWGEVTGVMTSYKQTTVEDVAEHIPGPAGKEIGEMFQFSSDFAYNAFQADTLKVWDLEKMGIQVPTTTLREYVETEDWVAAGVVTANTVNMRTYDDSFSGQKIYPGKGKLYIRGDSKIFRFQNGKTESLFLQRKNPRKISWTTLYRRQHKKGISEEVAKKRTRRTVKHQRAIVGASLDVIKERRSQRPEARSAARAAAIKEGKEKKAASESAKKAEKAKSAAAGARGQVNKIQSKQGSKGAAPKVQARTR
ncbi:NmrA-like family protein [Stagonosporopsis vannaccii]|nr:NmrA-like family protein [Stagonosporopsis vannaccii]